MIKRDKLWKAILENRFREFLLFFFPTYQDQIDWGKPFEFIDKELVELFPESATSERYVDKLVKVYMRSGDDHWFLVHIEVQGKRDNSFPARMYEYHYRIRDRYKKEVTAVAILTDSSKKWKPQVYRSSFMGTTVVYKYNLYKLAIQNREDLVKSDNIFALIMLAAYDALKAPKDDEGKLRMKVGLARLLLSKGYTLQETQDVFTFLKFYTQFSAKEYQQTFDQTVQSLTQQSNTEPMGIIEYVSEALREDIFNEGVEKGMEKGVKKGREEGMSLKEKSFIIRLWETDEFSLPKIALLVGVTEGQVLAIVTAHLLDSGKTEDETTAILAEHRQRHEAGNGEG